VVLDHLDPDKKHIHHRLFRESCYCTPEGVYVKDLRILNRHLSKVVLVDNAAYSYAYQPLNGVPIIPYYEGKNDYELPALQKYIESLIFSYDVREKNKQIFKLDRYSEF
jgi:CTD small phosphatase-like protein 2